MQTILSLLIIIHMYHVTTAPTTETLTNQQITKIKSLRQKKAPNYPFQTYHQVLVPSLQVIPIHGDHWHNQVHNISQHNQILVPIHNFVPVHELVPVNQLSVIPLQRMKDSMQRMYQYHDENRFRNPIGGYGVGWRFGGHGAGHGFHYSFG